MVFWGVVIVVLALVLGYAALRDRRGTPFRISRSSSGEAERDIAEARQISENRPNRYPPPGGLH